MIVLITGVAGFIGFHTAKCYLDEGHVVVGIDNLNDYYDPLLKVSRLLELGVIYDNTLVINLSNKYNFKFIKADISDWSSWELLKQFEITDVIHLAAQAGVRYSLINPNAYIQSNIVGFQFLLNFCSDLNISQILYASSSSVYGKNSIQPFVESEDCSMPESLYAATKRANELMAYSFFKTKGITSIGLRFFTVYGPWGRPDMAPMLFAKAALKSESIDIFNNGNQSRDFTYIDDITNGILLTHKALKENKILGAEVMNIGRGEPVELMVFIENLELLFNVKLYKNFKEAQLGDVTETYSNTSKLNNLTGYKPKVDLNVGLKYFVDWYKDYYKCL